MSDWSVYMLRCADGSLYTGIAKDVSRRIAQHNSGRGAKYTKPRRPVALAHREDGYAHGDALRREYAIKKLSRREKLALVLA